MTDRLLSNYKRRWQRVPLLRFCPQRLYNGYTKETTDDEPDGHANEFVFFGEDEMEGGSHSENKLRLNSARALIPGPQTPEARDQRRRGGFPAQSDSDAHVPLSRERISLRW